MRATPDTIAACRARALQGSRRASPTIMTSPKPPATTIALLIFPPATADTRAAMAMSIGHVDRRRRWASRATHKASSHTVDRACDGESKFRIVP